jgi:hypothetical protein
VLDSSCLHEVLTYSWPSVEFVTPYHLLRGIIERTIIFQESMWNSGCPRSVTSRALVIRHKSPSFFPSHYTLLIICAGAFYLMPPDRQLGRAQRTGQAAISSFIQVPRRQRLEEVDSTTLTSEQQFVYDKVLLGEGIFVTGNAG